MNNLLKNGSYVLDKNNFFDPVFIKNLDQNFYIGARNELTSERLIQMMKLANSLPKPYRFGVFSDETYYLQSLRLMLGSTAETRHRGLFINRLVLPLLTSKDKLCDIGPGDRRLTGWVGNKFNEIDIIDNNKKVIEDFNAVRKKIKLNKMLNSIIDIHLSKNYYDLILLSHVLYYIDQEKWLEVVIKAYEATKPKGAIVVALSGDKFDKANLLNYFGGKSIDTDMLAMACVNRFGSKNVEIYSSRETIIAIDLITMLHIAGFLLGDVNGTAGEKELVKYVNTHYQKLPNYYEMSTQ